jgi:hypothetical protein
MEEVVAAPEILDAVDIVCVHSLPHERGEAIFGALESVTSGFGHQS